VLNQTHKNFKILFIDDFSNYTRKQKSHIIKKLKNHTVKFNKERRHSVYNAYKMLHECTENDDAVVLNLDGDDWLFNDNVLAHLSKIYRQNPNCLLTYGECLLWGGEEYSRSSHLIKEYTNIPYPKRIIRKSAYRLEPFYPLHPRTWKVWVFKKIEKADFLRPDGSWLEFAEDQAMFLPMLEMANGRFQVIKKPLYAYNVASKHSDTKRNLIKLLKDELIIRKKKPYAPIN